ncbi:MAG: nitrous oxide reductase family maturation protein NosD [Pseudomonadota bacterium]|nr:nitrous oxide reductase family maturation protein NosD [Pseudomonadota bacterium]
MRRAQHRGGLLGTPRFAQPTALLAVLALTATASVGFAPEQEPVRGETEHAAVRTEVNAPKPVFPLYMRDKRIHGLKPFQALVDAAPAGSVLRPPPGNYAGPVNLTKPLTIDGGGKVSIDAGDKGSVFTISTDGAVLRGVRLTGSGDVHDTEDACLEIRGHRNVVENLVIDNCLFGIDLRQSNENIVRNNHISSKPADLGVRGDGLRLWYSMNNLIEGNSLIDTRDFVVWYANGNKILNNIGRRSRYSMHFMFAQSNVVEGNRYYDNAVGIYVMYTEGITIRNNLISHATGATGMGIGFKEASNTVVENNDIIYCATGIASDLSPYQPDSKIWIRNNRIAYNGIGMLFNNERVGNIVTDNVFEGNLTHVAVNGAGTVRGNTWRGNYWDDYQGFDRDNDGRGDNAYETYAYADRIWMERPHALFFKNAPLMEALDFLERLAPFSTPNLILRDDTPRFTKPARYGVQRPS